MSAVLLASYGALVGFSLGLTGSGGSIIAIPLLVYGVGLTVPQALVISLFMVGSLAAFGAVRQTLSQQVDWRSALIFSLSGMVVSPLVVQVTREIEDTVRISLFAVLMIIAAWRMVATQPRLPASVDKKKISLVFIVGGGALAGALAGFFGVGGGFIIVPLLIFLFSMPYNRAVGTSLACIALISMSALVGHSIDGIILDIRIVIVFIGGGLLGMLLGIVIMKKIPERRSRQVFAGVTILLAAWMLFDKFYLYSGGIS